MNDLYPALPGSRIHFKDRQLTLSPDPITTQSVLVIGTATDGPVMTPVSVRNADDLAIFGKATDSFGNHNGATIIKGVHEVWAGGCRDVRVLRISGKKAKNALVGEDFTEQVTQPVEDYLGMALGNNETEITLNRVNVDTDKIIDIDVVVNGRTLNKSAFDLAGNIVTIFAGTTDGMADVTVFYTFERHNEVQLVNEPMVAIDATYRTFRDAENRILWNKDKEDEFEIDVQGYGKLSSTAYDIDWDNATVTITDDSIVIDGNTKVTYSTSVIEKVTYTPNDVDEDGNSRGTHPLAVEDAIYTHADNQEFTLSEVPVYSTFKLYANGYLVDASDYYLSAGNKKVTLKPGVAKVNANITARYMTSKTETRKSKITIEAISAGELYNDVSVQVLPHTHANGVATGEKIIKIVKPESKKDRNHEEPLEFNTMDYKTFESLVNAINAHPYNNVVQAYTEQGQTLSKNLKDTGVLYLAGGDDGLNLTPDEMYDKLGGEKDDNGNIIEFGAYDILEHYSVDIVVPQGVYADKPAGAMGEKCFAQQLAQFCAVASMRNNQVMGYIPTSPAKSANLKDLYEKVQELNMMRRQGRFDFYMRNLRGEIMIDEEGRPIDSGKFIGIVAMAEGINSHPQLGVYQTNACNFIAGFISSLPSDIGPTNKTLPAMNSLRYTLSLDQLNSLTESHFITVSKKMRNGFNQIFIVDGPTMAQPTSDYTRITSMRSLKAAADLVREVSDPYIGNGYGASEQAAHTTELQQKLDSLVKTNKIRDFQFQIHASLQDQVLGNAIIELEIVPKFELRRLKTLVALRPSL